MRRISELVSKQNGLAERLFGARSIGVRGLEMLRVNVGWYFGIGRAVDALSKIQAGRKLGELQFELELSRIALQALLGNQVFRLRNSIQPGMTLIQTFEPLIGADDLDRRVTENEASSIRSAYQSFESVLNNEVNIWPTYFVSQKLIYDTDLLIESAEFALSEDVRRKIPTRAVEDINQAGKCLAFEVPTAAGYHTVRAAEAVLRKWRAQLIEGATEDDPIDWGPCEKELEKAGADEPTISRLRDLRRLDRNPIMHPEAFLTMEDALDLFEKAKSAIKAVADQLAVPAGEVSSENEQGARARATTCCCMSGPRR